MTDCVTVFGATGFIGRHLVSLLLRSDTTVRVAVRHPGRVQITAEAARAPDYIQADVLDMSLLTLQSRERVRSSTSSAF